MAEEIDDDSVADSWEDFEENPDFLERQLKKLEMNNKKVINRNDTIVVNNDMHCSSPPLSQEPKIMILRRPQATLTEPTEENFFSKNKAPLKSLQQRQAEYAEARLRILGNSGSSESDEAHKLDSIEGSLTPINNEFSDATVPENSHSTSLLSSGTMKPVAFIKPTANVNVIRSPRAPSDSQPGFQSRIKDNGPS